MIKLNMYLVGFYINDKLRLLHNVERYREPNDTWEIHGVYVSQDNGSVIHVIGYMFDGGLITEWMSNEDKELAKNRYLDGTVFQD